MATGPRCLRRGGIPQTTTCGMSHILDILRRMAEDNDNSTASEPTSGPKPPPDDKSWIEVESIRGSGPGKRERKGPHDDEQRHR